MFSGSPGPGGRGSQPQQLQRHLCPALPGYDRYECLMVSDNSRTGQFPYRTIPIPDNPHTGQFPYRTIPIRHLNHPGKLSSRLFFYPDKMISGELFGRLIVRKSCLIRSKLLPWHCRYMPVYDYSWYLKFMFSENQQYALVVKQ